MVQLVAPIILIDIAGLSDTYCFAYFSAELI